MYIEPGSPWENGYVGSFNGKLRDELLNREVFYPLLEVQVLTEQYRQTCNRQAPQFPGLPAASAGSYIAYRTCSSAGRANIECGTNSVGRSLVKVTMCQLTHLRTVPFQSRRCKSS